MNALKIRRFACTVVLLIFGGCDSRPAAPSAVRSQEDQIPVVVTTSYPLFVLTQSLAEHNCDVVFPMANVDSPRHWKPSIIDTQRLQQADLMLLNGAGYEPWRAFLSLPQSRTVDTSAAYANQLLRTDGSVTHQHGPRGAGDNSGLAWTTWLDPILLRQQLTCVSQQLQKLSPELSQEISTREAVVDEELDALNDELQKLVTPADDTIVVLADGPYYGYLAKRLNWRLHQTDFSDGRSLDAQADSFPKNVRNLKPNLLLLRENAQATTRALFEATGVPIATVDLCESERAAQTLTQRLNRNVANLKAALSIDE